MQDNEINEFIDVETITSASKPEISRYLDALDLLGEPVFVAGDELIIERYTNFKNSSKQWLDTRRYTVVSIDPETGDVKLFDDCYKQSAYTNYKTASRHGDILKIYNKTNKKK